MRSIMKKIVLLAAIMLFLTAGAAFVFAAVDSGTKVEVKNELDPGNVRAKGFFASNNTSEDTRAKLPGTIVPKTEKEIQKSKMLTTLYIFLIGYFLMLIFVNGINKVVKDIKSKHLLRKGAIYFFNILIFIFVVLVWSQMLSSVTVFVSFIGAGVALALQEAILCVAGWLMIIFRRPFDVGDRVEFGGIKGDVIDIKMFQTNMLEIGNWVDADQSTGRIVNVPNSNVFKKEQYNYNKGFEFIWNEMKILLTYESDWKKGEEILLKHANELGIGKEEIVKRKISNMTRSYMIKFGKLTPIVYVDIKESGVLLTLRYLTEARKRRITQDELNRKILEDFRKEKNVKFAYSTRRVVND
ncbi:MAG: mechanosensitive ion channel [Candidatus Omnitrophica bacterium]|nr:mechanosensitive ion channel [Candidatus Omnitrophota bacterium]